MAHGHEVLHMMAGNTYESKEALVKAIINKFGEAERFHTCSAEGMTAAQLVDFLEARGKFMPASSNQFTVDDDTNPVFDEAKRCGAAGIPCFVLEDGTVTLRPEEAGLSSNASDAPACNIDGSGC